MSIGNNQFLKTLRWRLYHDYLEFRVCCIRRKKTIRFGFLIQELSQWKTERLYLAMLAHPRFEPVLCISHNDWYPGSEMVMMDYCGRQGYKSVSLDPTRTFREQIKLDMVTLQKPYRTEIPVAFQPDNNRGLPYVVIPYYLGTITTSWIVNQRLNILCWRQFVDNESCKRAWSRMHALGGSTYRVTGSPMMDELLTPKESLPDVWPVRDGRKRIIFAPHHTIADMHKEGIGYSTFLDYCDFMLEMRDKYQDRVFFVFKPHPALRFRLNEYWGKEKTDCYFAKWEKEGCSHIETGRYVSLFKYSDAMIHDCASFTVEYLYTDKPAMYLLKDEHHEDNMIPYAKEAFDLHYKGRSQKDIESFILDIINDEDPLKEKRARFKEKNLLPPNGKTACENIIDSILGE